MDFSVTGNYALKLGRDTMPVLSTLRKFALQAAVAAGRFLSHVPDLLERPRE
jgi:hypothetical protein